MVLMVLIIFNSGCSAARSRRNRAANHTGATVHPQQGHRSSRSETGKSLLDNVGIAKLGDFGLAMYYKEAKPGNICGTPNFIAPEVLNDSVHEPASDVWALGKHILTSIGLYV